MSKLTFQLQHTDKATEARAGIITTDHGQIETPIFMPVGTVGSVKAVHVDELKDDIKAQIILGNTYHLYLRPGLEILEQAGGLHKFNGFDRPMLTDSGGFQVFSLTGLRKMTEEGVTFQSHIDGSRHLFTPERVMDIERSIGADIIMAFDECTPGTADYNYAKKSMERTHRWLDRCITRFNETEPKYGYHQSLFPIVQGCVYKDLRTKSAEYIASKDAEGNAIGGLAVGEPAEVEFMRTVARTAARIQRNGCIFLYKIPDCPFGYALALYRQEESVLGGRFFRYHSISFVIDVIVQDHLHRAVKRHDRLLASLAVNLELPS